ncbi:MAG: hypothetical protein WD232_09980 [Acidimicrobiales bacterium]
MPVLALVPALALAACGGGDTEAAPTTTAQPTTSTTTTTTTEVEVDVTSVPEEIDEAYVQAVVDRFDVLLQEAYAAAMASGTFDGDFEARLRALYGGLEAERLLENLRRVGTEPFADPPGLPTTTVLDVMTARRDCIFLTAERDLTPLSDETYEQVQPYYLQLVAATPGPLNETPWVLARDVYFADGAQLGDQCA